MREQRTAGIAGRLHAIVVTLLVAGLTAGCTQDQSARSARASNLPRTPDGKPDLNGIWQSLSAANSDIQDHSAKAGPPEMGAIGAVPPGQGIVVGNVLPYLPSAAEKRKQNFENRMSADPELKCYLPGIPRATYMPYPFQVVQSENTVLMVYQYASASRSIDMSGTTDAPVPTWMGYSNGKWDGDTLVVDVTGFNDQTWFDRSGNFHGEALHVTERYTMTGPDHISYEAEIEDPEVFSQSWKISLPLYRRVEPNVQLLDYKCIEFAEPLLYGHLSKPISN